MKEATGDMTMTIVVIIGIIAVLAIGRAIWPRIQARINQEVDNVAYVEVVEDYNI